MCIFAPHSFKRHNTVLGSTITITTSDKGVNLQKEHLRILRKRFDDCRGFGGGLAFEFKIEMNKNHIIMKRILTILLVTIVLISCQTDSEKADKLRLGNKFDEAAELYQKAADEGDAYAMWRLSNAYANGDGVDWDETKALELLKQSAQAGCEEAKCYLAFAYIFDWYNIGKDEEKGKEILEGLIKQTKNSTVLSRYAGLMFIGDGPYEEDQEKAMRVLKKVEDKDNPFYLDLMGAIYTLGTDEIEVDAEKAIEYYTKAFENGRKYSAYRLQSIYTAGYGEIKADKAKRIEWLNRGIESNVLDCMVDMALLSIIEDSTYKDMHNPQKAIDLLKRAARHGSGKAYYTMGNLFYESKYLPKDDNKAFENWKKAVELKYHQAASNLAYAYIDGVGCDKDMAKGIELHKLAVDNGSGFSANKLFYCYLNGIWGVKKDKELAKTYLLKAAKFDDPWGCYNLGRQYFMGNDLVNKDYTQAFVYIKKAADMGLVDACSSLAYLYENGIGIDKNPQKAKEYRDKTIANENKKNKEWKQ